MRRSVILLVLLTGSAFAAERPLNYPVVGTGQTKCYGNRGEIAPLGPGQPFFGQDAQHRSVQPS
jgi:hypothetical protein